MLKMLGWRARWIQGWYQGVVTKESTRARYWSGWCWDDTGERSGEERQAVPREMRLQACETWCNPHGCWCSLSQHSSHDEMISRSDKMGKRSTALALVLMMSQGRQEEDWTSSSAPPSKEGSKFRMERGWPVCSHDLAETGFHNYFSVPVVPVTRPVKHIA